MYFVVNYVKVVIQSISSHIHLTRIYIKLPNFFYQELTRFLLSILTG